MVKKIRIRFSLVIVLAVLAILTFIVVSINLINYQSITNNADDILEVLALNGGQFTTKPQGNDYSPELPFETRYFTVKVYGDRIDPNENSYFANVKNIAAVDEKTAIKDACRIEHYMSDITFDAIKAHMKQYGS